MKIKILEVNTKEVFDIWFEIYGKVFPKPEDQFPYDFIWEWKNKQAETEQNMLLINVDGQNIGFIWQMVNKKIKTAYYYYMGILEKFRSQGIFTEVQIKNEDYLSKIGVDIILAEPENPKLMEGEEKEGSVRRIKFYVEKINFTIVSDKEIQYLRHYPPDKLDKIQDYYMMSFRILSEDLESNLIKNNCLLKEGYKTIYLNQTKIELGIDDEKKLRDKSKAACKFLTELDKLKTDRISLINKDNLVEYLEKL